jgi:hypothetical protein
MRITILRYVSFALGLSALLTLAPSFVSADTTGAGILQVYVQVINPDGYTRAPGDFSIIVTGQNPSINNFPGSQSGTTVVLTNGAYTVTAANVPGFSPSYSQGCSGNMLANQTATCIVTESGSVYGIPPQPYQYVCSQYGSPYGCTTQNIPLTCTPATQTVRAGQQATFTANGGGSTVYNWVTPDRTYISVGSQLTTILSTVGTQMVTVSSGGQSATCAVNVVANPNNAIVGVNTPSITSTYVPNLPNTGFAPKDAAGFAFAIVVLLASAIFFAPYAKKAVIATWR